MRRWFLFKSALRNFTIICNDADNENTVDYTYFYEPAYYFKRHDNSM